MKCPECGTSNSEGAQWCKFCGEQLGRGKQKTVVEKSAGPAQQSAGGNAGAKRRTLYEPPQGTGTPPAQKQPTMKMPPPQGGDDFFDRPQQQRQQLNTEDPWAHIADKGGYHDPQPPPPQPSPGDDWSREPRPPKKGTIIDHGPGPSAPLVPGRTIRGALFIQVNRGGVPGRPGGISTRVVPLYEGRSTLGRDDDRDIVIDDDRTSAQHGFINIEGDNAIFMDASTNGSKVDDQVVKFGPASLQHGSVIQTGSARIVVALLPAGLL